MDARISLLSAMTKTEFDGTSFNGPSLVKTLVDLEFDQVASPSTQGGYTVWGIVLHLIYWQDYLTRELGGESGFQEFPYEQTDWPAIPDDKTDEAWQAVLSNQMIAHTTYIATLEDFPSTSLTDDLPAWKCSYLKAVSWMATHDLFHAVQIRNMGIK